jgi:hypothetical protein
MIAGGRNVEGNRSKAEDNRGKAEDTRSKVEQAIEPEPAIEVEQAAPVTHG